MTDDSKCMELWFKLEIDKRVACKMKMRNMYLGEFFNHMINLSAIWTVSSLISYFNVNGTLGPVKMNHIPRSFILFSLSYYIFYHYKFTTKERYYYGHELKYNMLQLDIIDNVNNNPPIDDKFIHFKQEYNNIHHISYSNREKNLAITDLMEESGNYNRSMIEYIIPRRTWTDKKRILLENLN